MKNEPLNIEQWSSETQEVCRLCLGKLKSILEQVNVEEIEVRDAKSFYNLSNSIAAVSKSVHQLEMSSRDRSLVLRDVRRGFVAECQRLMSDQPELMVQVLEILERAETLTLQRLEEQ